MKRVQPVPFGPSGAQHLGWLHTTHAASARAVVICPAFGYEAVCTQRTLRHLAAALATAGLPTLRFDYHGTGDADGDDTDPDRVAAWLTSIHLAVDAARAATGAGEVVLIGLRLGALLALHASEHRTDIAGVAGVAPIISGKAYVRELMALQGSLGLAPPPPPHTAPFREAVGFALTEATVTTLQGLELTTAQLEAQPCLLLDRDDLKQPKLAKLVASAPRARLDAMTGYAAMMQDPHKAEVPTPLVATLVTWAKALAPCPQDRAGTATSASAHTLPMAPPAYAEQAWIVGLWRGIVTVPVGRTLPTVDRPSDESVVVMLNAGAVPHQGPNRLYVRLARRLAAQGQASVRMDMPGLGETPITPPRAENVVYPANGIAQTIELIRELQRYYRRVSVLGLCSGAYHALRAATHGAVVAHAVIINPLTYAWTEGMSLEATAAHFVGESQRYAESARSWAAWQKLLRGQVDVRRIANVYGRRLKHRAVEELRQLASRAGVRLGNDLSRELRVATEAGARLHFIFSASDPGLAMLTDQAGHAVAELRRAQALTIDVIDGPDHTFTPVWSHEVLLRAIEAHLL